MEQYKQVGNAVPVNLAKDIGVQIAKVLKEI
jgi:DNA (cytosine-5)-methyltransferase 1